MNNLDKQYQALLQDILDNGVEKNTRNGKVLSVFGRSIRYKFKDGKFPLLTTKKMHWKSIVTELLWFLRGDTNIKYLIDNDCHIWDGDAYKNYVKHNQFSSNATWLKPVPLENGYNGATLYSQEEFINKIKTDDEFAKKWGSLGKIYGFQWRNWTNKKKFKSLNDGEFSHIYIDIPIDQIQALINDLKTNPDSRRLIVSAWNPSDLPNMVLPPCHYGFQVYTRELSWYDDLDKIKEIYINWSLSKPSGGYAGDIKVDTIESANQIFVDGWQNNKDPFTGKPLIELECFSSIPKRAISLMWNQRSVDTFLGLPFNIASYGLLLEIIAKEVNMVPDELIGNLGDTHLYLNHVEQAKEQIGRGYTPNERSDMLKDAMSWRLYNKAINEGNDMSEHYETYKIPKHTREPYPLPNLVYLDEYHYLTDNEIVREISFSEKIMKFRPDFFKVENYQSHPTIKAVLSN